MACTCGYHGFDDLGSEQFFACDECEAKAERDEQDEVMSLFFCDCGLPKCPESELCQACLADAEAA